MIYFDKHYSCQDFHSFCTHKKHIDEEPFKSSTYARKVSQFHIKCEDCKCIAHIFDNKLASIQLSIGANTYYIYKNGIGVYSYDIFKCFNRKCTMNIKMTEIDITTIYNRMEKLLLLA